MSHFDFKIEYFRRIDSTNTELKRRALRGAPSGTVIVADEQTAGRGRLGRSFFSPAGSGLYMSLLLRPVAFADAGRITTFSAVAVARALDSLGVKTEIKWVNDLLAGGKKLCGILAEAGTVDGEPFAVIGIGINLARTAFPEELANIATSVEEQTGKIPHRDDVVREILSNFSKIDVENREFSPTWMDEYRARCSLLGKAVRVFPFGGEPFDAVAIAIEDDGSLVVKPDTPSDAAPVALSSAEVSVRAATRP